MSNFDGKDLDRFLMRRFHKEDRDACAHWAMEAPENLDALWLNFRRGEPPVPQLAAWVLDKVCDIDREFIRPYLPELIGMLGSLCTDGEKRTAMRLLAGFREYPGENLGHLLNVAFEWLNNPQESIAVRVHCMQVLYNISRIEPDIRQELALVLRSHYEDGSTGFRNRAGKILSKLK